MGARPNCYTDVWALLGQDGGQSIDIGGERTLFVFSDTLLTARTMSRPEHSVPPALRAEVGTKGVFLANCAGVARGCDVRQAWSGIDYFLDPMRFPREILAASLRERAQEIRFWPLHGVLWNDAVYFFYIGVQTIDPTTIWGFRNVGSGVARLDPRTGECERLSSRDDWRFWRSLHADMHFGAQIVRDGDLCYVFGSRQDGLYSHAILARVPIGELGDVRAYAYLQSTEPTWSESFDQLCDLGRCASDFSVSYNAHLGRYLMLYIDPYEKMLTMRTSELVWGPYSAPSPIVAVPHAETSEMVYLGFEHPNFTPDAGRTVFLSYCQPHFKNNSLLALKFR